MSDVRGKEQVEMLYRLVKNGDDIELHQEMVFRFSPGQAKSLLYFLEEAIPYHTDESYAVGGGDIYDLSFGPKEIDYEQPIEADKHFLTIDYIPVRKSRDGFPQTIYIYKERTLKLFELLKTVLQKD